MARQTKRSKQTLSSCRYRLSMAKNFREHEELDKLWNRLIDLYRGKQFPANMRQEDVVAVNVCFATINVIAPSVAINHPKISLNASTPEDDDSATIAEAALNYWWRHYNFTPEFQRAVKDMLILGFGWLKTGWRFQEVEADDPNYQSAVSDAQGQANDYAAQNPHLADSLPSDEEIAANIPSTMMTVAEDRPFMERVSPFDVYVDPEATSMNDITWIAQRTTKCLDEIRLNNSYKAGVRSRVQADSRVNDNWLPSDRRSQRAEEAKRVTIWEMYDLKANTVCVFAESGDDFLVDPTPMPYAFGQPFTMLRNYDAPDQFYPIGELEMLEPLQHELNILRSQTLNDRKRYRRKWLYKQEAFDKVGRSMLESDEDNVAIPVNSQMPLGEVLVPMPVSALPPDFYNQSQEIQGDMTWVSGVTEYQQGALPEIRRTATEAAMIQDAANARAADKLARVEAVISGVARKLVQLAQEYLTNDMVIRITGQDGNNHWAHVEPDWIKGEFEFTVEAGSTQPLNEAGRRQQAMQLMQTLAPFANPQMGLVNLPEVLRFVLRDGFGIKDAERFLQAPQQGAALGHPDGPPPPPQQPGAPDQGPPPPDGGMPPPDQQAQAAGDAGGPPSPPGAGGIPPQILAQIASRVGYNAPNQGP